ncbi:sigma-E factor regulatory protein RseB domain-containing protein [Bacillus sp. JJ1764]|uniref:sigma-E factor regulatory protein RseB domain-containing protein n=1 Tax=Bacillus sp. JJ1764 TaxID=3122964 RepID=UPI002FFE7FC0
MENKRNEIKSKMDKTVFQDIHFTEAHQQKVLESIKQGRVQKRETSILNGFNVLLSVTVTTILFIGIAYFVGKQMHFFEKAQNNQASYHEEEINKANKDIIVPPKQKENIKNMTKEEILTKMLNTVDYFETAKGSFKMHYDNSPLTMIIEYELSLHKNAGGFSKITNLDNGPSQVLYHYYTGGKLWDLDESKGAYLEMDYQLENFSSNTLTIGEAFRVDNDGINVTNMRERPLIGEAQSSLFPYEIASNYTRDLNKWNIEKQNEELLGHNTLVIKGTLNSYAKVKHKAATFRFWVDKDTGILVKYETYDESGKIVDYLHPTKLEVNVPIDSKKFVPNLNGYKKQTMYQGKVSSNITENRQNGLTENPANRDHTTVISIESQNMLESIPSIKGWSFVAKAKSNK